MDLMFGVLPTQFAGFAVGARHKAITSDSERNIKLALTTNYLEFRVRTFLFYKSRTVGSG
jgi:hypothetical protein